jgi:A/G-specific adenine glycosylase
VKLVIAWFDEHQRLLPWRAPDVTPWGVLVSEFMLQQTQVDRVVPRWVAWMHDWPTPAALAQAPLADVLRAWHGLGYPRRALRLHATACAIVETWDGQVPADEADLRTLPGVGAYTAAAVAAFAYGRPAVVLDTNIRRVLARAWTGVAGPKAHQTKDELQLAASLVDPSTGAAWAAAVMELGAVVCTARSPHCTQCPLAGRCAWVAAGRPDNGPVRRAQARFDGSDRQARGALLRAVSAVEGASEHDLALVWADAEQRERALAGLLADGLVARAPGGYVLPPHP